ncbi:MAG: TonB-dependent receptor [Bacteroidota bacterium]
MKIKYALLAFLLMPILVSGQVLSGTIVDETSSPVSGAYIVHLQSDHHAHSNELGQFFLNGVSIGDTLQVLHLGYETAIYPVEKLGEEIKISLTETIFQLDEIVIGQNSKNTSIIAAIDLTNTPVNSAQEVLRTVPGLFIGQHAGGGKAEQIFLRGFDIDHGTDVAIGVDGMPVNMVSHAHGQGYADLHFLIPETIEAVDFGKGPYYADKGNFNTAGYVEFQTKERLDNSQVTMEIGQFNSLRTFGALNLVKSDKHNAYVAAEYISTDGAFNASQNFLRNNVMAKYTAQLGNQSKLSVLASHFDSKWDASGQIPQRAVDSGLIDRFGAIDSTEGGSTSRTNIAVSFNRNLNANTLIKNRMYYSRYDFELYSNFTFFLEDPENGDQIRQREVRDILGFESQLNYSTFLDNTSLLMRVAVGLRSDNVRDNELSWTRNRRETLRPVRLGEVDEQNIYAYASADFDFGDLLVQPGVRVDYFRFNYTDELATLYSNQSQDRTAVSPKLNFIYNLNQNTQLFLKTGIGFHSNDARVIVQREADDILPAAYGADLGVILKPFRRMVINTSLWYLLSEQEFVYVGDAGIVEPSGESRRLGVDFGLRYQLTDWLFLNGDVNYAYARSVDEPEDADRIPLAPTVTSTGGLSVRHKGFNGSLRFRYIADRPANEDNSIVAPGYFITDLNANYEWKNISIGFIIENLFDQEWNETQFATESRLANEPESVEEIHFTPGVPFFFKGIIRYKF